jgi:hypothetical protein
MGGSSFRGGSLANYLASTSLAVSQLSCLSLSAQTGGDLIVCCWLANSTRIAYLAKIRSYPAARSTMKGPQNLSFVIAISADARSNGARVLDVSVAS